jgi:hypothetical protein
MGGIGAKGSKHIENGTGSEQDNKQAVSRDNGQHVIDGRYSRR